MHFKQCSVICLVCLIAIRAKQGLKISPKYRAEKDDIKIIDGTKTFNTSKKLLHGVKYFNKNINTKGEFKSLDFWVHVEILQFQKLFQILSNLYKPVSRNFYGPAPFKNTSRPN